MDKIKEIIKNYLVEDKIDSALFINGKWGIGKTYYYINEIEKLIKETESVIGKNYEPIYISLNGISSTSDIVSQITSNIFVQKLPRKLKKNITFRLSSLAFEIFNTISVFIKDKELKDLNRIDLFNFIDFRNKVICLDDLERISEKISIEEILGFISRNFLENQYTKVIVIGSEEDLDEKNKVKFLIRKEKIFYREIKFEQDHTKIFESLCDQLLRDDQLREIVKNKQDIFIKLFKQYKIENLRTIRSILLSINHSFNNFDTSFFKKLINNIILFTIVVLKEFKEGKINYTLTEAYGKLNFQMDNRVKFAAMVQSDNNPYKNDYSYKFYDTYIKPNNDIYSFFRAIYSYIIYGYSEKKLYDLDEHELKENRKDVLLDSLVWFQELSNQEELNGACEELLIYIKKGDILFYSYPYIFSKYEELIENKIYAKSLDQIYTSFSTGLNISFTNYNQSVLDENKSMTKDTDSQYLKKLKEKVNFYHEEIQQRKEKEIAEEIFIEFDHGTAEFQNYLNIFYKKELFKYIEPSFIWNRLLIANPRTISSFNSFLHQKYQNDSYLIFEDIKGLEKIDIVLKDKIQGVVDNLKKYALNGVIDQIELILRELRRKKGK